MIYADENVWIPVVEGLRRRGWDATTAREQGTLGDPDEKHLQYAADRGWTVLTFDDDFLTIVTTDLSDVDHSGVIYASQDGNDVGDLVGRIDGTLQAADSDLTNEILFA